MSRTLNVYILKAQEKNASTFLKDFLIPLGQEFYNTYMPFEMNKGGGLGNGKNYWCSLNCFWNQTFCPVKTTFVKQVHLFFVSQRTDFLL